METNFDYYAFISYNREDEKKAKWLQNKLENYKLPAVIRKEKSDLPKEIRPVFRDKTGMEAGAIIDTIQEKLKRSQYLIVICSPEAAKSNWVGTEINAFMEMGRSDRIIPFIVDGVPNSNDSRECFHQHIKEIIPEPLGINIKEIGKQQAFVKTAAKLLNLRFEVLWDRFQIAQRKRRLIAAVAGLLCLAALGWAFDYFYPKYEYYADYTDKKGIPEGIVKLDKAQVKVRNAHYRFVYTERILRKVVYANSAGTPIEHNNPEYADRPSILELEYVGGRLNKTIIKNARGKTTAAYLWDEDYNGIDIKNDEFSGSDDILGASYMFLTNIYEDKGKKATMKRFKLERNDDGYITRRLYKQINGHDDDEYGASNIDGVWGLEYDLDNLGRPVQVRYLGPDGKYLPNDVGVMGNNNEYDGYGNTYKVTYFGKDGKPVLNEMLWSIVVCETDINGNIISEYFLDHNGEPYLHKDGVAKVTFKYDKHGNRTEETYFDIDGKPCLPKEGYAKMTSKYDGRGNRKEVAFFGTDGRPCLHEYGFARVTSKYDGRGNRKEETYFGTDGKPCLHEYGFAKVKCKYNKQGNMTEASYFDATGKPCLTKDGYARVRFKFDEQGNLEEEAYFGIDDKPCLMADGFAKATYKYDERGNMLEAAFFGTDGKQPCLNEVGFAKATYKYDERGNRIEEAYFGTDGKPCLMAEGFAKATYKYDERGNMVEVAYFGTDGKPHLNKDGFAKAIGKFDERGNMFLTTYFDVYGKVISIWRP